MADEEILKRIDAHMERGNALVAEVVKEHRLNRAFAGEQMALMRTVVERNGEAFRGLVAELGHFRERIDVFGERIDSFGETLDLQRQVLLRFLDRLDDDRRPPQG